MTDHYAEAQNLAKRIEILSRLAPMVQSDEEYGLVLSVLMETISEAATRLRRTLEAMVREEGGRDLQNN